MNPMVTQQLDVPDVDPDFQMISMDTDDFMDDPPLANIPSSSSATTLQQPPQHQLTLHFTTGALAMTHNTTAQIQAAKQGDRCAVCVKEYCRKRWDCNGRGNRSKCACGHPPLAKGERVRNIPEEKIERYLAAQAAAI